MKKILSLFFTIAIATSCGNNKQQQATTEAAVTQAKQATIDSVNRANNKQKTIDSLKAIVAEKEKPKEDTGKTVAQPVAVEHQQKKGWNSTTKGAVIGTGAGAITGALVSKHKGKGALVGGLIGLGAGAGTGAIIDNSKKKKDHNQ